jgi:hypothetical protein
MTDQRAALILFARRNTANGTSSFRKLSPRPAASAEPPSIKSQCRPLRLNSGGIVRLDVIGPAKTSDKRRWFRAHELWSVAQSAPHCTGQQTASTYGTDRSKLAVPFTLPTDFARADNEARPSARNSWHEARHQAVYRYENTESCACDHRNRPSHQ